jgi:hypothetical protein
MKLLIVVFLLQAIATSAQVASNYNSFTSDAATENAGSGVSKLYGGRKLFQRNLGMIAGIQRGKNTAIEFGGEAHWRKISVLKPHVFGATANMEYNFSSNVIGYKAGVWMKRGRINLTYGANISYYDNFKGGSRFGFGPSVGLRLLGLHLVNGLTFLTKDNSAANEKPVDVNTLYVSLRYYFPVDNKFTWDKNTRRKKRERRKEREERKKEREENKEKKDKKENKDNEEPGGLKKLFGKKNKEKEADKDPEPEQKGLKKFFKSKRQN